MKLYLKKTSWLVALALLFCIGCEPDKKTKDANEPSAEDNVQTAPAATKPAPTKMAEKTETPVQPAAPAAPEVKPMQMASPDETAVTVNGVNITEGQIDEMIKPQLDRMLANAKMRKMPENFLDDAKKKLHDQGVEAAILNELIEEDMAKNKIVVSDEEITKHIEEMAAQQNMTLEDLKTLIESGGQDFNQWKQRMQFDKRVAIDKLIEINGLGSMEVTEEQALAYYDGNKETFEVPEQVKASHILVKPDTSDPNITPEAADAKAREKSEQLLKQIKDGADFAELAKANSDCPSSAQGGDLGYGNRRTWVESFSDAAFALEPNQVSDIVQTRFGYHIIKVADHQKGGMRSFDEVKSGVMDMLKMQKQQELMMKYFDLIKNKATIVYPPGKEPPAKPAPTAQ